ncbi:histidine kinase [Paenibacillus turpanensis]|uniref:histidine kinase n=1 Tax=Paenibacillus turpanensis TaxID=2689078 RepID=UPI00140C885C|nr:histidine kinase [Paenibacillus turpanensis]
MEQFRRKTPEELLQSIENLHRGRFKIYIGAVSGSGKTYHMLREGQLLRRQGVDVVCSAVEALNRPETLEQMEGLECIPGISWYDRDGMKEDLDVEAVLARNPEVVLTDGLAHRNRKGAVIGTRLEDIRVLLTKGISVIVTVNVYELDGARELARQLTGIETAETVPDGVLDEADEVRLIDVSPETMLQRIGDGCLGEQVHQQFYEKGNLSILREIALRLMAEGVNDSLEKYRDEKGFSGPSGVTERILVATQYHWNGSIYVRRGQQIAKRLNGDLWVISFVPMRGKLTKDRFAFRHTIRKLCDKLGAPLHELPAPSRRKLPKQLLAFANQHKVTRIVIGHSKQTPWQEFWRGSFVNGLLRQMKGVDIFIVADRTESEGERILPAMLPGMESQPGDPYRRLLPDEMERRIYEIKRGRFKVYIGAAPGVGKTYTMLREGNDLLQRGVHVVIGLLETHGRKETEEQVGKLAQVPLKTIEYRGAKLKELNMEEILRIRPDVVLVDELAHTNVPGSDRKKRYEDVLELLKAGISVVSTMNVQHLESLNDAVEQLTGIRVRETVPDSILRDADQVELIDVAPSALQQRLREGKVYAMDKVEQSLKHFFKTGNLIALRELALREIADDVDERLEAWERTSSLRGPYRRKETICVCVSLRGDADRLIRRGFRIAHRLKAAWYTVFIVTPDQVQHELYLSRMETIRAMTERLGGTLLVQEAASRKEIGRSLLRAAAALGCTQLILGQTKQPWWKRWRRGDVMRTIGLHGRHMDVLVVSRK